MPSLYHPTIPDVVREDVPDDQVDAWVEQGWLKSEPKSKVITETRKASERAQKVSAKAFSSAKAVTPGVSDIPPVDPDVHGNASETPAE